MFSKQWKSHILFLIHLYLFSLLYLNIYYKLEKCAHHIFFCLFFLLERAYMYIVKQILIFKGF